MRRSTFLSYGTSDFVAARDELCASAEAVGFDTVLRRGPDDLDKEFKTTTAEILKQPRGGGYYAWKPQIIMQELEKLRQGELLVYCDAGRYNYYNLHMFPHRLAKIARANGMLLNATVPQHSNLARWTKRDCLILMGMDLPEIISLPQIQSGWSFWTPCDKAFDFLQKWLDFCSDPRCITDAPNTLGLPNYSEFVDHRHDQSILTLLIYREAAPHLDYTARGLDRILKLRPGSQLAQRFMARIDDAERMERSPMIWALLRAFLDLRNSRTSN